MRLVLWGLIAGCVLSLALFVRHVVWAQMRPQTRQEMLTALVRASVEKWGDTDERYLPWCELQVDEYLRQVNHPLRKKYSHGLEVMNQEEIRELYREVAGTPWADVVLQETTFGDIQQVLGSRFFPDVRRSSLSDAVLSGAVAGILALITVLTSILGAGPAHRRRGSVGAALDWFSWFLVDEESQSSAQFSAADLRSRVRDMRKKRCGRWHVLAVRFWITTTTIVPIVRDACERFAKQLPLLGSVVRAASALLRKIDPPRLG